MINIYLMHLDYLSRSFSSGRNLSGAANEFSFYCSVRTRCALRFNKTTFKRVLHPRAPKQ